ncbi:phage tail tape measure protein [Lentilactobacillus buchneri]|uniref:phage tail tape measure protein n=1 Tax=Lentilactobacillus buchneri TaxID=1581 RepID=UPI0021A25EF4|nr:phage tail tape measure protein [Lentilactobacillus buchneri]MCT2881916.1 phage tail tape measure protein [Lentilactobacillus buchneri]
MADSRKSYIEIGWKVDTSGLRKAEALTDKSIRQQEEKTRKTGQTANNESKVTDEVNQQNNAQERVNQQLQKGNSELSRSDRLSKNVGQTYTQHVQRVKESAQHMQRLGNSMQNVGRAASVVSLGIGAGFAYSAKKAMALQNQYKTITNLAHYGGERMAEAQRNVNRMQNNGTKYSEKYGVAQKQISSGYEELIRRGYTSNQALAAQKTFLQGSIASGDEYSDVVHNATAAIEAFGLRSNNTATMTKNTKEAVNQMAYAADLTATDFKGMGNGLQYVGSIAHGANQSLSETASALGILSNNGQEASVAGTGLRQVLSRLTNPPVKGKYVTAMKQLGLTADDFKDAKGNLLSLQDIFQKLNSTMDKKGLNGTARTSVYGALFGQTGMTTATILGKNVSQLKSLNNQVDRAQNMKGGGYIAQLSGKNMQTAQNQWKRFKETATAVGVEMSKTLLPAAQSLLEKAADVGAKFTELPKPVKSLVSYLTLATAAAGPLILGAGKLVSAVGILKAASTGSNAFDLGFSGKGASGKGAGINAASAVNAVPTSRLGSALNVGKSMAKGYGYFELASQGIQFGQNAVNVMSKGINSNSGMHSALQGGGQLLGAGIGMYLGGPAGAGIGAQIGGSIAKYIGDASKDVVKQNHKWSDNPKHGVDRNSTFIPNVGWSFDPRHLTSQNGKEPARHPAYQATSASRADSSMAMANVDGATQGYIKRVTKLEQNANAEWANSTGKASKKVKQTYDSLYSAAASYANKRLSTDKKNYNYLQKEGLLSANQAQSSYNKEKSGVQERLASLRKNIDSLVRTDKDGGAKRVAAISKVNRQILNLTDQGTQKQKALLRSMNRQTTHLTTQQYAHVITSSRKAYNETVKDARKTYSSTVNYANARYDKEVSAAKKIKGISASQRASIIKNAEKQRSSTISKAHSQYTDTVSWAEKQRQRVVAAAKKEAGAAVNAFKEGAQYIGTSIPALLASNFAAGLNGIQKQFKSSDLTQSRSSGLLKQNSTLNKISSGSAGHIPGQNGTASKAARTKLPGSVFGGHATGGPISHTGAAVVGENGVEMAYNARTGQYRLLGTNGPSVEHLQAGWHVINAKDTRKLLNGGLGRGITLQGYAKGTTKPKTAKTRVSANIGGVDLSGTENETRKSMRRIENDVVGGYDMAVKQSRSKLTRFGKESGKKWQDIHGDTSKETQKMQKDTVGNYDDLQKHSMVQVNQLNKQSNSKFRNIRGDTKKLTQKLQRNTVGDFDDMQKGANVQMAQMHKQVVGKAQDTASNFGSAMGHMDNYAHSAMSNAIGQLNKGFSSLNGVFSQFGGNKSTLKLAKYAQGTGPIDHDQMAVVNDSKTGPHQEIIIRGSHMLMPQGHDVVTPLRKGDEVVNGHDVAGAQNAGILPHFAKGTSHNALRKLIKANDAHPAKEFANDFLSKIDPSGAAIQKASDSLARRAANSLGDKWSSAAWSALASAMSSGGSGAGGNWRHTPGLAETNGFGAPRSFGSHDGVDFSGPMGSSILAVHGGKVTRVGNPVWGKSALGEVITVASDDGWQEIYQEFGGMNNIKVSKGDVIKTGQRIATLGALNGAGSGSHVHIGVAHGSLWDHGGSNTHGWYDVTKMHGHDSGTPKNHKSDKKSGLDKLVSKQLAPQIKWVSKNLQDSFGDLSGFGLSGGLASRARTLAKAIKQLYPSATDAGIAAVLGNWEFESGLNPAAINPGGGASGLGQWLGGRKTSLINFAHRHGKNWHSAAAQLEYALEGDGSDSSLLRSILRGHGSVSSLASRFSTGWERGGYTAQHVNGAKKVAAALGYAKGGRPAVGQSVLVGENGPELARFDQPVKVYSNKQTKNMAGQTTTGRRSPVTINLKVNVKADTEAGGRKAGKAVAAQVKDTLRNLFDNELDNLEY